MFGIKCANSSLSSKDKKLFWTIQYRTGNIVFRLKGGRQSLGFRSDKI